MKRAKGKVLGSTSQLALTPPMGWNSWNTFGKEVSDIVVRETADVMVATGLKDAGYGYVVIDDHWHGGRDKKGYLYPDPVKFPNGMKAVADYVHSKGLKFGIYSDAGIKTCGGQPGSHQYEEKDAKIFASWDVDFLKYDYCHAPTDYKTAMRRYRKMGAALQATKRPILFSICEWGDRSPWLWGAEVGGHMWRVSGDVVKKWDAPHSKGYGLGILSGVDRMSGLEDFAGPGHWNDPDMLVVGIIASNTLTGEGCTETDWRTQMSMWCILAAPLMMGNDIRNMTPAVREILANKEVIALDQDPLGKQGFRCARTGALEVWKKPLSNDRIAVALWNRGETSATIKARWENLGIDVNKAMNVRDLWAHKDLGSAAGSYILDVPAHGTVVLLMTP